MLAKIDAQVVYILDTNMNLQVLEKFNESNHVCKVVACLETSEEDKQIATKIAIENPLGAEDCPESTMTLSEYMENIQKNENWNGKA